MLVPLGQFTELFRVFKGMRTVKIEPSPNSVMVTFIFAAMAPLVARHAMEYLNLDSGKKVGHPITGNEGRIRVVIHDLFYGNETALIGLKWSC